MCICLIFCFFVNSGLKNIATGLWPGSISCDTGIHKTMKWKDSSNDFSPRNSVHSVTRPISLNKFIFELLVKLFALYQHYMHTRLL